MATPPKSTPRPRIVKKVAAPVVPVGKIAPVAKVSAAKTAKEPEQAAPFVIEAEGLSAFVDKSDSALPSTKKKIAEAPVVKSPVAESPVVPVATTPAVSPVEEPASVEPVAVEAEVAPAAPSLIETSIIDTKASTPPQPAAAEEKVAAKEPAAQRQTPNALEGHTIMNEAIETSKKFAEDAKVRLQGIVTDFNEKAKVAVEKSSKTAEEFSDIAKGNLEALVESSKIAAKGFETLGQSAAEYGRSSYEKTSATLKSFASVKSPTEFFQLQSDLFTASFDTLASETAKTSEALLKLAGEIAQPISNRYSVVSDKLKSLAA